ncbi:MAG: hypothetical protein GY724_04215, partial [Actinomycetia bacterium]|nr:hypothetical protein [Actinomycetes bacterium]
EGIFHLGTDDLEDQVFVNSSDAPLTVYSGDLLDDLVIDMSETTGGVDASLIDHATNDNTGVLTGVLGGLLTFTDLGTFSLTLGSDNDDLTVNTNQYGHLSTTELYLNGGGSDDDFFVHSLNHQTGFGGGDGDDMVELRILGYPTDGQYTDLNLDIETLVVDNHTSSQPTAWVLTDGTLTADKIPTEGVIQVASSDGAELVRILGGSSGSDTLEV